MCCCWVRRGGRCWCGESVYGGFRRRDRRWRDWFGDGRTGGGRRQEAVARSGLRGSSLQRRVLDSRTPFRQQGMIGVGRLSGQDGLRWIFGGKVAPVPWFRRWNPTHWNRPCWKKIRRTRCLWRLHLDGKLRKEVEGSKDCGDEMDIDGFLKEKKKSERCVWNTPQAYD